MTLTLPGMTPTPTSLSIRRGLTLTQPWAGLVASGIKLVENRPRKIISPHDFGKPFAIHASREISKPEMRRILEIAPELGVLPQPWTKLASVTSAIIGVATIDKVLDGGWDEESIRKYADEICFSDGKRLGREQVRWFFGPVGYLLRDVRALKEPVPCKGALGFWGLSESIAKQVTAQLEAA